MSSLRSLVRLMVVALALSATFCPTAYGEDSLSPREIEIYAPYPWITNANLANWRASTVALFAELGVESSQTNRLNTATWLKLWSMADLSSDSPDFLRLRQNILYWREFLDVHHLNQFILTTTHGNPYHLLCMNEESWKAMAQFLEGAHIFAPLNSSPRSLQNFLLTHHWAEGIVTSGKTDPQLWMEWGEIFDQYPHAQRALEARFSAERLRLNDNHDLIQRVYTSMTKDLLRVVKANLSLISDEFLVEAITAQRNFMYSWYARDIDKVFTQLEAMLANPPPRLAKKLNRHKLAQAVPEILELVFSDPSTLVYPKNFLFAVEEGLKRTSQKCEEATQSRKRHKL